MRKKTGEVFCPRYLRRYGVLIALLVLIAPAGVQSRHGGARGQENQAGPALAPEEIVTGLYGAGPGDYVPCVSDDGTVLGITSFCVDENGVVTVADAAGRRLRAYGGGVRRKDVALPEGRRALRVASQGGRTYVLCSRRMGGGEGRRDAEEAGGSAVGDSENAPGASGDGECLSLLVYSDVSCRWEVDETVIALEAPGPGSEFGRNLERGVVLAVCAGEACLYDPHMGRHIRLTLSGGRPLGREFRPRWLSGRPLPCGARVTRYGRGISLLWEDGSRRDMPWLAGSLIGGDSAGRLYMCEIDHEADHANVCVAVYNGDARPVSRWALPGRPGDVRMLGPRVVVSADGGVYEYWSTHSSFHIVRWRVGDRGPTADWTVDL